LYFFIELSRFLEAIVNLVENRKQGLKSQVFELQATKSLLAILS
jgi:hypothetical protein